MDEIAVVYHSWKDMQGTLEQINPELFDIIEKWNPPKEYGFYKVSYPFGALILDEGRLCLPKTNGEMVFLNDALVPEHLRKALSYSSFPVGLPIGCHTEAFIELDRRVIPLASFSQGMPIGLLETLDLDESCCMRNVWSVAAGTRAAFMLPKISDKVGHRKLEQAYNIWMLKPQSFFDHAHIFQQLASSTNFKDSWSCDVLFLNKNWFQEDSKNMGWILFDRYLHQFMTRYSSYTRNKATFDVMWQLFTKQMNEMNLKVSVHLYDILKHIIALMLGAAPGYRPIFEDNSKGPIRAIQEIYLKDYNIEYCPTVMSPHHFNFYLDNRPIYYSLPHPSHFESVPRNNKTVSHLTDLKHLSTLVSHFVKMAKKGDLKIVGTILEKAVKMTSVDLFHSDGESFSSISSSSNIPKEDETFVKLDKKGSRMAYPEKNGFLRACIRIKANR